MSARSASGPGPAGDSAAHQLRALARQNPQQAEVLHSAAAALPFAGSGGEREALADDVELMLLTGGADGLLITTAARLVRGLP